MKGSFVDPSVHLCMRPALTDGMADFLAEVDGKDWYQDIRSNSDLTDSEIAVSAAGKLCYRSFDVGTNLNITSVRKEPDKYLANILKQKHGSVLEHGQYMFGFNNVSRVFTHELVRHRVGTAISQESLRYVRLGKIDIWLPKRLVPHKSRITHIIETLEEEGEELYEQMTKEDMDFSEKKKITSDIRRVASLPGAATRLFWSANIRTLRHVIEMRTAPGAEEEIRLVFGKVAEICKQEFPMLMQDFEIIDSYDGLDVWKPIHSKV